MAYGFVNENEINCPICKDILNDALECSKCGTNYCRQCINKVIETNEKKKLNNECPLCKKKLELFENIVFRQILLKQIQFYCKKCHKPFLDQNIYEEHIKKCKLFKCRVCHKQYCSIEFFKHIMDEHKEIVLKFSNKKFKGNPFLKEINASVLYENKLIEFTTPINLNNIIDKTDSNKKFDNNKLINKDNNISSDSNTNNNTQENSNIISNSNSNSNNNSVGNVEIHSDSFPGSKYPLGQDVKKVNYKEGDYINLFRPKNEIPYPNDNIKIPSDKNLSNNQLYYCGKKTNLNCDCCPDGRCKEKNCICKDCMDFNKKVKFLGDHYLINKHARAAKFGYGSFRCLGTYIKLIEINGIKNKQKIQCKSPNDPCPGCQALNSLYKQYLSPDIYNTFQ